LLVGQEVEVNYYETDLPAFDPIGATNHGHLWHRGFPLQLVAKRDYSRKSRKKVRVDIQADFWNGDPDIDAVGRMEHAPECKFDSAPFPMASNKMSPWNSQNSFVKMDVLKDYFQFPFIGRMDDIWASYYCQARGFQLVFNKASVYQERNVQDLTRNLRDEFLGYEHNLKLLDDLNRDPESILAYVPGRSAWAFELYRRHFRK